MMRVLESFVILLAGVVSALSQTCGHGAFRGVSDDCTKFEKCDWNEWVRFTCAPGTVYDWRINVCNFPTLVDCSSPCNDFPCSNGGTCSPSLDSGYVCDCPAGFSGTSCQVRDGGDGNGCSFSPCRNGGSCFVTSSNSGYTCQCTSSYTGINCESPISGGTCAFSQCRNGGTCFVTNNGYVCQCPAGYTGVNCESPTSTGICYNQCQNGGTCLLEGSGYRCQCQLGYTGTHCQDYMGSCAFGSELPVENECEKFLYCNNFRLYETYNCPSGANYNPTTQECDANYYCKDDPGQGTCEEGAKQPRPDCTQFWYCQNGFWQTYNCPKGSQYNPTWGSCHMGYTCTGSNLPCDRSPCKNGGTCNDQGTTSYYCNCLPGYTGFQCESPTFSPCQNTPCYNGGTCVNQGTGSYYCTCLPGFTGIQCQTRTITPCDNSPCYNGGSCTNQGTGYYCNCRPGYTGSQCQTITNFPCNSNPCYNGGTCSNQGNSYFCACRSGYTGTQCQTRTTFACDNNPCLNGGTCTNQGSSYFCRCPQGYSGTRCQDTTDPNIPTGFCFGNERYLADPSDCAQFYACLNNQWRVFRCPTGAPRFSREAGTCTYIFNATCDSRRTTCAQNTQLYDDDVNCMQYFRCVNNNWQLERCSSGLRFDRAQMQCSSTASCPTASTPCDSDPCVNGVCNNNGNTFFCSCPTDYTGDFCQTPILPCDSNPCFNSGTCNNNGNTYTCTCPAGFTGSRCETRSLPCDGTPCLNGGVCDNVGTSYTCLCPSLYTGSNCETFMSACANNPCRNGGNCTALTTSIYTCSCPLGFTGTTCDLEIIDGGWSDWILDGTPSPCDKICGGGQVTFGRKRECNNPVPQNGGLDCAGNASEVLTVPCNEDPCPCDANPCGSGTCRDLTQTSFSCDCPPGTSGMLCDQEIIDGGWSDWILDGTPSPCDKICGGGQVTFGRKRECNNPVPQNGGLDCAGNASEVLTVPCNEDPCPCDANPCGSGTCRDLTQTSFSCACPPGTSGMLCDQVDGGWSDWVNVGNPSSCSAVCGGGQQQQAQGRECNNPAPLNGGQTCQGLSTREITLDCNNETCPCDAQPCNSGNCTDIAINAFSCECPVYQIGPQCDIDCLYPCPPDVLYMFPDLTDTTKTVTCRQGTRGSITCPQGQTFSISRGFCT